VENTAKTLAAYTLMKQYSLYSPSIKHGINRTDTENYMHVLNKYSTLVICLRNVHHNKECKNKDWHLRENATDSFSESAGHNKNDE